jgi:hypothetical protein
MIAPTNKIKAERDAELDRIIAESDRRLAVREEDDDWEEDEELEEIEDEPQEDGMPAPTVSLMITQAQKAALREKGYTDEQIRELTPEQAHRALGLIG